MVKLMKRGLFCDSIFKICGLHSLLQLLRYITLHQRCYRLTWRCTYSEIFLLLMCFLIESVKNSSIQIKFLLKWFPGSQSINCMASQQKTFESLFPDIKTSFCFILFLAGNKHDEIREEVDCEKEKEKKKY